MKNKLSINIALSLLLVVEAHGQEPNPLGGQFQINTYTTSDQSNPAVVSDSNGNFIVVWESSGSFGSDNHITSIQGQRFRPDGTPLSGEFQINTFTLFRQRFAAASTAPGGSFVVVWESESTNTGDNSGYSIKGQRYDASGMTNGSEFQVNTYTTNNQFFPFVSSDSNGDFVVVWESKGSDGNDPTGYSIQGQRYTAGGAEIDSQFQINTYTPGNQRFFLAESPLAMDAAGNFVVVWTSTDYPNGGGDGSGSSVRGRRYASNGTAMGADFPINTYTTGDQRLPSAAVAPDGGFVVTWESDGSAGTDTDARSIQARRFDSDGTPIEDDFQVNTYTTAKQILPMAGTDSNGRVVIAWESGDHSGNGADGELGGIRAQFFDVDGTAAGSEFQVNSYTPGNQRYPSVAMGPGRDFMVVWDGPEDNGSNGIQGRRFLSPDPRPPQEPIPLGPEIQINTYTTGDQSNSAVVSESNGDFIVVWESSGSFGADTHFTSIQGQHLDSDLTLVDGQFQINTFSLFRQRFAAAATAPDGSSIVVWQSESTDTGDDSGSSIKGQRYDADGMVGSEIQVNSYTTGNQLFPFVSSDSNGEFVVVWESKGSSGSDPTGYSIQGQRFNSDGMTIGSQFQINTQTPGNQRFFLAESPLAMDAAGNFVVVWTNTDYPNGGGDGSGSSARGRHYASNGAAMGPDFQINTYTTGDQRLPSASAASDGGFVVTWESDGSNGTDTDACSIQARRFAFDGTPTGNDFQVNTYTTAKQILPMAGTDSNGRVIIAWESGDHSGDGADGELGGIRAQFFDADGTTVGGEFQVNSYTQGNQRYPSVAMGPDRDFVVVWDGPGDGSSYSIRGRRFTTALVLPGFSKGFMPDLIDLGERATLTFTIDNTANPVAVDNLAFADNLPPGTVVANPPGSSNDCGGVLNANAGTAIISLTGGTVDAGSACTLQVDIDATACGMHVNTTGGLASDAGNSGTATDTLTVNCIDLELTKTESVDPVPASGNLTYTIKVGNSGSLPATDLFLAEALTLPIGVTVDSITASPGTSYDPPNDTHGTWTVGTVSSGAEATLTVMLAVGAKTSRGTDVICDTLTVTAVNEPNVGETSVTECTSVVSDLIFMDGFESGDTSAWSGTVSGN